MAKNGINDLGEISYGDGWYGTSKRKSIRVIIAAGQKLSKYCPLGRNEADKKHYKFDKTKSDGTEKLFGILESNIDTTDGECTASVCVVCEVDKDFIDKALGASMDADSYNYGNIIIRKVSA